MTEEFIIELVKTTLYTTALLSAPPLLTMVVVGLGSQIVQTVTQLKDQSLSFIPKVVITSVIMLMMLPWYIQVLQQYFATIFNHLSKGPM